MSSDSPQFEEILKQVPPDYYDSGTKSNLLQKYWHSHKWTNLAKLLENRKATLLDIGCADGTTATAIKKLFPKLVITGLDKYADAIKYAKKTKPDITFIQGDAHKLPFKKGFFDFVVAIETLEHLHDPDQALLEIHRVLKKNGYLIIVQDTDSVLFKTVWWFWTKWKGSVWNHSHINCLKPDGLIKKVKKASFKVKSVKYANLGMEVFIKAQKK
jgi:ubiquinone/menaquinone biosynthesis C-methylase UbiE